MFLKIVGTLVGLVVVFLAYVSTRPSHFHYERSGLINAPAAKIYPYISNLREGEKWSPYSKMDPGMKETFSGTDGTVGSKLIFESSKAGSGTLEILKLTPNESAELNLAMTAPMKADNLVKYTLKPEGSGTRFTWSMEGDGGFVGKLVATIINCEKMVGGQFEDGIANLKALAESH